MSQTINRDFYTIPEAANRLKVSVSTVWRWIDSGRLIAYRVGQRRIRIKKEDLAATVRPVREERQAEWAETGEGTQIFKMSAHEASDQSAVIERARTLAEQILARRGGKLLPPSWKDINRARDERTAEL